MDKFSSVPMSTQVLQKYESKENDVRFTKVKLWLMHLGENKNGSIFNKEAVIKAIPSLANTPIMASIGEGTDFSGHEVEEVYNDDTGEINVKHKTVPFGVIPEVNNAKFEKRLGDDMVEREYLTVEGLLWNKWGDAVEILYNKNGVTGQSMELSNDFEGYYEKSNFIFTDFQFYGACLLGDNVTPAMINSTVELSFSNDTQKLIDERIQQFNTINFSSEEGGNNLPTKEDKLNYDQEVTEDEVREENGDDEAQVQEEEMNEKQVSEQDEKDKAKGKKAKTKAQKKEEEEDDLDLGGDDDEEEEAEEEVKQEEAKPVKDQVTIEVETLEDAAEVRKQIKEHQDKLPPAKKLVTVLGKEYSVEEIESVFKEFSALKQEVHEEKVQSLLNKYSNNLSTDEIDSLKEKSNTLSINELETEIFAAIGKKAYSTDNTSFSAKVDEFNGIRVPVFTDSKAKLNIYEAILEELK